MHSSWVGSLIQKTLNIIMYFPDIMGINTGLPELSAKDSSGTVSYAAGFFYFYW